MPARAGHVEHTHLICDDKLIYQYIQDSVVIIFGLGFAVYKAGGSPLTNLPIHECLHNISLSPAQAVIGIGS